MLAVLLVCVATPTELAAQATTLNIIYVNAETGDDAHAGTARYPVQTLNEALARADALVNPPAGLPQSAKIKVFASSVPIAPVGFGGHEAEGWWEQGSQAFPIRMIDGVDILGIPDPATTDLPRIEIVEPSVAGAYSYALGEQAFVRGASNCTLSRFVIDGTDLEDARGVYGVVATDVLNFDIEYCDILEQHDGVRYFASAGMTCSGALTGCTLTDFYPIAWSGPGGPKEEGHAGLWLEGGDGGSVSVTVTGSKFLRSHDAIEIAGPVPGSQFEANLTVIDCDINDNENGIEIVGRGTLETYVSDGRFIDNYNGRPGLNGATASSAPISCFAALGMTVKACLRDCRFENFSVGVLFKPFDNSMDSCLDMGRDAFDPVCCTGDIPGDSPGNNEFVLENDWDPLVKPFKVAVWNQFEPNGVPNDRFIRASQNTWLLGDQGSDPITGCLDIGEVELVIVTPPSYMDGDVPGRNFGILDPNTGIDFGDQCPSQ